MNLEMLEKATLIGSMTSGAKAGVLISLFGNFVYPYALEYAPAVSEFVADTIDFLTNYHQNTHNCYNSLSGDCHLMA